MPENTSAPAAKPQVDLGPGVYGHLTGERLRPSRIPTYAADVARFRADFEAAKRARYTVRAWDRETEIPVMPPVVAFTDGPGSDEREDEARTLVRALSETLPRQDGHAVARVYPHQLGSEIGVALAGITFHFAGDRAHEPATFAFAEAGTNLLRDLLTDLQRSILLDEQQRHESPSCRDDPGAVTPRSSSDADAGTSAAAHGMRKRDRGRGFLMARSALARVAARIAAAATHP